MARTSVLYSYDVAVRALAYARFGSILNMSQLGSTDTERINKGVLYCPKRIAPRYAAEKRGETFLEFINVYRNQVQFSWARNRSVVARRGMTYQLADGSSATIKSDAIDLTYDMWVWSDDLDVINLCIEKYLQWQHETPEVTITYSSEFEMRPDLQFSPVVDESRIEDLYDMGKVWVYRMPIAIEAWLPKDPGEQIGRIDKIRLTIYDMDDVTSYSAIIVPDSNQDAEKEAQLRLSREQIYQIVGTSVVARSFTINRDRTGDFSAGDKILVRGSTDNDDVYTIVSASYSDNKTTLVMQQSPVSSIADGAICKVEG